jgi:PAS domain S-box-containing protein
MEERLQESEKLYRSLFDSMLNAFQYSKMIFDQGTPVDYIYLDVNGVFESLTGLKDVIGRKVSEVLPGILQSDPELFHILARVALSGNHEKFDINVKALNKWFSASAYSPAKEYFVVIFEDINERKLAEETLRERELILRTMFDQSYQLMAMSTPDGRFLRVNATALDLVGVREEDVLGKYLWDTPWWSHSEDEQNKIKDGLRRAAAGETVRYVTTHYDTSGNPHYIDISLKPVMDENGVVTMILPEGRDITERKRVDEELRKLNEELEQRVANRTAELTAKTNQLERINKTFVDRELRMRELKERIAELEKNVKSEK